MSKTAEISVLTANRLGDGIVVFLDFEGAWSDSLAEAVVARSSDELRALQDRGTYDAEHSLVVEPYLVEVRETAGGLVPIRYRERVRAAGPSILDDVPGYAAPAAVLRQAQHGVGDRGLKGPAYREQHTQHRPEPVEGRTTSGTLVVREADHEDGDRGDGGDADRARHIRPRPEQHTQPRPEPVEGRAASSTQAQAA